MANPEGCWYEIKGWLIPLLAAAFLILAATPVFSDGGNPVVRIEPVESTVPVDQSVTVSVIIDDASDLGGFQFDLLYNSTTVAVDEARLGDLLGSAERLTITVGPKIDNDAGKVTFGAAGYGSSQGPNGTGALALITFTGLDVGVSDLQLQRVWVVDTAGNPQTYTVEDGSLEVSCPTAITLSSFVARSSAGGSVRQDTSFAWRSVGLVGFLALIVMGGGLSVRQRLR